MAAVAATRTTQSRGLRALAARLLTRGPLATGQAVPSAQPQRGRLTDTRKAREWQSEAFGYYDDLGGIHYAHTYIGNACSKLVLEPAVLNPDGGEPLDLDDSAAGIGSHDQALAHDATDRLGEQSELNRLGCMNLSIAGESLVVFKAKTAGAPEEITARSVMEVRMNADGTVTLGGQYGKGGEKLGPEDDVLRIWKTHPKEKSLADSWMRSVRDDCLELMLLNREIRANVQSRLATAGMLLLPTGLSLGPIDPSAEGTSDDLVEQLMDAMARAISTPGDPMAVIPLILQGEGELLDKVRYVVAERTIDAARAALREEKLRVIAIASDLPPEVMTGKADLNHWTGAVIDDNTNAAHIQPLSRIWAGGLTAGYLRPACIAAGMSEDVASRIVFRVNSSQLVIRPNRSEDAKEAHDRFVLSDEALRGYLGFPESDAPTAEEIAQRLAQKRGNVDAPIVEALIHLLLPNLLVERSAPPAIGAGGDGGDGNKDDGSGDAAPQVSDGADPSTAPADNGEQAAARALVAAADRSPYRFGQRLMQLDRTLRTRVVSAADAALTRALEKAGNRAASAARRNDAALAAIAQVPRTHACAALGPAMLRSLGFATDADVFGDDPWGELADRFDEWTADTQEKALSLAGGWVGLGPADPAIVAASDRNATHRQTARDRLVASMSALATQRLYDPDPNAPADGEYDTALTVPHGMIREVVAIAGGSLTGQADPVTNAPAGGIGTGQTVTDLLGDHGVLADTYEWSWGGASRPFPPHEDLDGVTFTGWDDEALTNGEGWPDALCQPGDHEGCTCDAIPVFSVYAPSGRSDGGEDDAEAEAA